MDSNSEEKLDQTGPLNVDEIKELSHLQTIQEQLNRKQKRKHELKKEDVKNQPIQIKRLVKSFKYAFQGIGYVLRTQPNMKIHFIIGTIAVILGFFFHISESEWLSLVLVIGFVIILEFINTAIESLVDLYSESFSFLAKVSKDVGAATVLVMAIISIVVGLIIFLPKIIQMVMLYGKI